MSRLYESEQEIEQVVHGFETCATPKTDFHHREHLTVAVCYLQTLSPTDAVARMRSALLRFWTIMVWTARSIANILLCSG